MLINEFKAECAKNNIRQKDIAKAINKTEQTVSKIFNKRAELKLSEIIILSDLLQLSNEKRGYIFLSNNLTKL